MLVGCVLSTWAHAHLRREASDRLRFDVERRAGDVVSAVEGEIAEHLELMTRMFVRTARWLEDQPPEDLPERRVLASHRRIVST